MVLPLKAVNTLPLTVPSVRDRICPSPSSLNTRASEEVVPPGSCEVLHRRLQVPGEIVALGRLDAVVGLPRRQIQRVPGRRALPAQVVAEALRHQVRAAGAAQTLHAHHVARRVVAVLVARRDAGPARAQRDGPVDPLTVRNHHPVVGVVGEPLLLDVGRGGGRGRTGGRRRRHRINTARL